MATSTMLDPAISTHAKILDRRLGVIDHGPRRREVVARLEELRSWIAVELSEIEADLATVSRRRSVVDRSARHLLDAGGKRLRPICVALAAKLGAGFGPAARDLAVAVELVHQATLLHDDVVDGGERRRGKPTARLIYGEAASIFAGDRLLVEALRRIRRAGVGELLDLMLATIDEMIAAEARQLENRGRIDAARADYFRIVVGKTAALFRWALFAGGKAGHLADEQCQTLARYGEQLGVAFQLMDDILDFSGDPGLTGKALLSDLRKGDITYPLLLALERDDTLRPEVETLLSCPGECLDAAPLHCRIVEALTTTGGLRDCRELARQRAREAVACLDSVPDGRSRSALVTVAQTTVLRRR